MLMTIGSRIGAYEITAALGAGGMGEVYRARDTRLGREAAIKILPDVFAASPDRLARFEREARVLASLNHPNIAQVYGLEQAVDGRALVMEFVEGEDLAQRLLRGALPLHDALVVARQIAEALEAAHEAGIVHRDLCVARWARRRREPSRPAGSQSELDGTLDRPLERGPSANGSALGLSL